MTLLAVLLIFLLGGVTVLFWILRTFVNNLEKPLAIPFLGMTIALYMVAALLLSRFVLPGLL